MPIKDKSLYPENWKEIVMQIRARSGGRCEGCGAENHQPHPITGSRVVLTVAHLDHIPANVDLSNLRDWCQRCHLRFDAIEHSENRRRNAYVQSLW